MFNPSPGFGRPSGSGAGLGSVSGMVGPWPCAPDDVAGPPSSSARSKVHNPGNSKASIFPSVPVPTQLYQQDEPEKEARSQADPEPPPRCHGQPRLALPTRNDT